MLKQGGVKITYMETEMGRKRGCYNECSAVKKNSVSLPGREREIKVVGGGGEEVWEEML